MNKKNMKVFDFSPNDPKISTWSIVKNFMTLFDRQTIFESCMFIIKIIKYIYDSILIIPISHNFDIIVILQFIRNQHNSLIVYVDFS